MTKTAFLFAGQGAQYLGMARDLYDQYNVVRATYDEASQVLGYDIRNLIDTVYSASDFDDFCGYLSVIAGGRNTSCHSSRSFSWRILCYGNRWCFGVYNGG